MTPTRAVLVFLLVLTGLRLATVGRIELSPDEAFYQMWSERLDWGYHTKGPGVAVIIRVGTALFGVNEFGVRFFSPILALGTSLVLFFLTRHLYGVGAAVWLAILLNVTPLFTAGSLLMTIDAPSVFFWSVSMAACWLALARDRPPAARLGWWLADRPRHRARFPVQIHQCDGTPVHRLGVCRSCGGGGWNSGGRGSTRMLLVALVVGSPPVFWNAAHAWITLSHLHDRGRLGTAFEKPFGEFLKFFTAHLGVYSPLVFVCLLVAVVSGWRRAGLRFLFWRRPPGNVPRSPEPDAEKARFLLAFGLPLVVMYTLLAFKTAGEPNWTAPGFLSLSVLAAALLARTRPRQPTRRHVLGVAALDRGARVPPWRCSTPICWRAAGIPVGLPPRTDRAAARLAHDRPGGGAIPQRRGTRTRRARLPDRQPLPTRRRTQFLLRRKARRGARVTRPCTCRNHKTSRRSFPSGRATIRSW